MHESSYRIKKSGLVVDRTMVEEWDRKFRDKEELDPTRTKACIRLLTQQNCNSQPEWCQWKDGSCLVEINHKQLRQQIQSNPTNVFVPYSAIMLAMVTNDRNAKTMATLQTQIHSLRVDHQALLYYMVSQLDESVILDGHTLLFLVALLQYKPTLDHWRQKTELVTYLVTTLNRLAKSVATRKSVTTSKRVSISSSSRPVSRRYLLLVAMSSLLGTVSASGGGQVYCDKVEKAGTELVRRSDVYHERPVLSPIEYQLLFADQTDDARACSLSAIQDINTMIDEWYSSAIATTKEACNSFWYKYIFGDYEISVPEFNSRLAKVTTGVELAQVLDHYSTSLLIPYDAIIASLDKVVCNGSGCGTCDFNEYGVTSVRTILIYTTILNVVLQSNTDMVNNNVMIIDNLVTGLGGTARTMVITLLRNVDGMDQNTDTLDSGIDDIVSVILTSVRNFFHTTENIEMVTKLQVKYQDLMDPPIGKNETTSMFAGMMDLINNLSTFCLTVGFTISATTGLYIVKALSSVIRTVR